MLFGRLQRSPDRSTRRKICRTGSGKSDEKYLGICSRPKLPASRPGFASGLAPQVPWNQRIGACQPRSWPRMAEGPVGDCDRLKRLRVAFSENRRRWVPRWTRAPPRIRNPPGSSSRHRRESCARRHGSCLAQVCGVRVKDTSFLANGSRGKYVVFRSRRKYVVFLKHKSAVKSMSYFSRKVTSVFAFWHGRQLRQKRKTRTRKLHYQKS